MRIGEIRNIIGAARWLRNDYAGHTTSEFARADVGPRLTAKIEQLRALVVPARFADDIARRDEEIEYCQRVIARWESLKNSPAAPQTPAAERAEIVAGR